MTSGAKFVPVLLLGLGLVSRTAAQNVLETAGLRLEVDGRGAIVKLVDPRSGRDHAPAGRPGYLVRVKSGGRELEPTGLRTGQDAWTFAFEGGIELRVRVARKADYLRFELVKALRSESIEAVLWGPIRTTIGETIGEVVGVVRDAGFAVGIQTLNAKTCGGQLVNEEGTTGGTTTATRKDSAPASRPSASTRPGTGSSPSGTSTRTSRSRPSRGSHWRGAPWPSSARRPTRCCP